jgi:hypothetical protein
VAVRFEDGLGRRHYADGSNGDPLEILVLRDELAAAPGFKEALRQRLERLASFRHPAFGNVRSVARLIKSEAAIAVISDRVTGIRLSDVLDAAGKDEVPIDMRTALWLTGQLVSAVAALHETGTDAFHGAIAPERIIVTPDARPVVVEHVVGAAMSQLRLPTSQYWKQYRIALAPSADGPVFDQRSDVMQIGAIALALVLGHALGDEFPSRIGGSAEGTAVLSADAALELLPDDLRWWLSRALQLDPDESFASAIEARDGFNRALTGVDQFGASNPFKAFMERHDGRAATAIAPAVPVVAPEDDAPLQMPLRRPEPQRPAVDDQEPVMPREVVKAFDSLPRDRAIASPLRVTFARKRVIAAAAVLVLIASASTFAARLYFRAPAAPAPTTGRLVVNTNPPGVRIAIDGQDRGTSPLRLELNSGDHVVDVVSASGRRSIPVTVKAGSEVAHFIDIPQAAVTSTGQLQIRTEPAGARVIVDGQPRGISPAMIDGLAPGIHQVSLQGPGGALTESVTVQAGAVASLIVPLNGAEGAPVSGWVAITAPVEVQLYENGRLLGSSHSDRIMAQVGKHDLEIVNDALALRVRRTVAVVAGRVTTIALDWPSGSLALNALPWADVWIDGQRIGETPIGNLSLPIGPHEVVFRHPDLGEQRYDAIVTLKGQARLSADLRRK